MLGNVRPSLMQWAAVCAFLLYAAGAFAADPPVGFESQIVPIFRAHCLNCHGGAGTEGGLDLSAADLLQRGGDSGPAIVPGDPDASLLIEYVSGDDPLMPQAGEPLSSDQVDLLRRWIAAGAEWPEGLVIRSDPRDWWSLRPLMRPAVPEVAAHDAGWVRNPVDAFIAHRQREQDLHHSPQADRRTLIRRLSFDLTGLPPGPEEVDEFVHDPDPRAYEKLVDRLLASPRYGERWARHWLDVIHYGDTHGYDKDKLRPNAWPYRDYVIRAFNGDKPYARFIEEQIAGDVLYPEDPDGVIATGAIAAGPWDFISHVEVPEEKIDGQIARNIDRDDMVRTVMESFCSVTVGCARCHDHKFDPIPQQDYYALQSVFAAVDRADRPFDADPDVHVRRQMLLAERAVLQQRQSALDAEVARLAGDELREIDGRIAALQQPAGERPPEYGYHSGIETQQDVDKWVQVDLGAPTAIAALEYVACHDDFNGIGAGFGFPVRYRIEVSSDSGFAADVVLIEDRMQADLPNPGVMPQRIELAADAPVTARYVRVTATKLAPRQNDYIFALAELRVLTTDGTNAALARPVTALDSIEAPVRWRTSNLVDGITPAGAAADVDVQLAELRELRAAHLAETVAAETIADVASVREQLTAIEADLSQLPAPGMVYAAATRFDAQGNFRATGGEPRPIHVLHRGNVLDPRDPALPGSLAMLDHLPPQFELPAGHSEGERRAALARWIAHPENPLTWRSIVNRVWQYHFGRGLCETPSDFGRMGAAPSHPELLDWLAVEFRDGGGSIKSLHRLICNSATYRQASQSASTEALTQHDNTARDGDNRSLWQFPRRRLEAEAVRDAVLHVAGKLDLRMYGPGFQDFVIEHPEHSPHYQYHLHDPEDAGSHRRAVYRFIVRSQQQPFMTTLDCADPSMHVDRRNETVTAPQALALLNNPFMVAMSVHFADRAAALGDSPEERVAAAFRLALSREPTPEERTELTAYAAEHGLPNACRVILNLNEFVFVD